MAYKLSEPIKFQMNLPEEINADLETLSRNRACAKSAIVRQALLAFIAHQLKHQPTCADGTNCLCPVMWQRQGTAPKLER